MTNSQGKIQLPGALWAEGANHKHGNRKTGQRDHGTNECQSQISSCSYFFRLKRLHLCHVRPRSNSTLRHEDGQPTRRWRFKSTHGRTSLKSFVLPSRPSPLSPTAPRAAAYGPRSAPAVRLRLSATSFVPRCAAVHSYPARLPARAFAHRPIHPATPVAPQQPMPRHRAHSASPTAALHSTAAPPHTSTADPGSVRCAADETQPKVTQTVAPPTQHPSVRHTSAQRPPSPTQEHAALLAAPHPPRSTSPATTAQPSHTLPPFHSQYFIKLKFKQDIRYALCLAMDRGTRGASIRAQPARGLA